jgi:hypothetical protein
VRQLAAAFETGPMCPFFKHQVEIGSKLPHFKGFASPKLFGGRIQAFHGDSIMFFIKGTRRCELWKSRVVSPSRLDQNGSAQGAALESICELNVSTT